MNRLRRWLRQWWECRRHQCTYYQHYLVYGPADLTHEGFHNAERQGLEHFDQCRFQGDGLCPRCLGWEKRLRA